MRGRFFLILVALASFAKADIVTFTLTGKTDISIFCPNSVTCFTSYTAQPFTLSFTTNEKVLKSNPPDWTSAPVTGFFKVGPAGVPLFNGALPDPNADYSLTSKVVISQNQLLWFEGFPTYALLGFTAPALANLGPGVSLTTSAVTATPNPENGGNQGTYGFVSTANFFVTKMYDVSLTAADDAAPEPQTLGLVAMGLGAVWVGVRRRRVSQR